MTRLTLRRTTPASMESIAHDRKQRETTAHPNPDFNYTEGTTLDIGTCMHTDGSRVRAAEHTDKDPLRKAGTTNATGSNAGVNTADKGE